MGLHYKDERVISSIDELLQKYRCYMERKNVSSKSKNILMHSP